MKRGIRVSEKLALIFLIYPHSRDTSNGLNHFKGETSR